MLLQARLALRHQGCRCQFRIFGSESFSRREESEPVGYSAGGLGIPPRPARRHGHVGYQPSRGRSRPVQKEASGGKERRRWRHPRTAPNIRGTGFVDVTWQLARSASATGAQTTRVKAIASRTTLPDRDHLPSACTAAHYTLRLKPGQRWTYSMRDRSGGSPHLSGRLCIFTPCSHSAVLHSTLNFDILENLQNWAKTWSRSACSLQKASETQRAFDIV